jgi:hypothetical protein
MFCWDISAILLSQNCHELNAWVKRHASSAGINAAKVSRHRTIAAKGSAEARHLPEARYRLHCPSALLQ